MNVIVTGSSGFIGYHLIKELLNAGHNVVGVDNNNDYYNPSLKLERLRLLNSESFKFYECDINAIHTDEREFDLAINLAAQPGVRIPESNQYLYEHSNINGFKNFCNFCINNDIDKIIYASSSSVYSDIDNLMFNESTTLLKPKSLYGESKLANEIYANNLANKSDIRLIGLRFFSVYGPYGRPDMAYYSFTNSIKKNRPITLINEGNMFRDMTFIDDIIDGILGAIAFLLNPSNKFSHELFNLGNNQPIKTSKLLSTLENLIGSSATIKQISTENESLKTHANINKAKDLLGYNPKISFDDGILRFLEWHDNYE